MSAALPQLLTEWVARSKIADLFIYHKAGILTSNERVAMWESFKVMECIASIQEFIQCFWGGGSLGLGIFLIYESYLEVHV